MDQASFIDKLVVRTCSDGGPCHSTESSAYDTEVTVEQRERHKFKAVVAT